MENVAPKGKTRRCLRLDLDQHRLRVGAVAPRETDAAEATRDDEERRIVGVQPLVEAEMTLAQDRRAVVEADLPAVRVAGENQRHFARRGLIEEIGMMREQQMRGAAGGWAAPPPG